jgi:superfamily II DNA/RNA helicase
MSSISATIPAPARPADRVHGRWRAISREEAKRRFRTGEADVLLCTDAAAEGLNFQFCGSLINYDMPWNPMRVEQRIGRAGVPSPRVEIDRHGKIVIMPGDSPNDRAAENPWDEVLTNAADQKRSS